MSDPEESGRRIHLGFIRNKIICRLGNVINPVSIEGRCATCHDRSSTRIVFERRNRSSFGVRRRRDHSGTIGKIKFHRRKMIIFRLPSALVGDSGAIGKIKLRRGKMIIFPRLRRRFNVTACSRGSLAPVPVCQYGGHGETNCYQLPR